VGTREFQAEVGWDLPNLAPGATSLLDVAVTGCRQGDLADAALASSTRFIELDAAAWTTDEVEQCRLRDPMPFFADSRVTARHRAGHWGHCQLDPRTLSPTQLSFVNARHYKPAGVLIECFRAG
jgi:hypothetical protein